MNRCCLQLAAIFVGLPLIWASAHGTARGDVLELTGGGRIEGRLVNPDDGKSDFVIDTAAGRVTIARRQVARLDATSDVEKEYQVQAKNAPDTIESHWRLYQWCRDHKLRDESQRHLSRILELDPNHVEARTLLGFQKKGGEWMSRDEIQADRGLVDYGGRLVTQQHVELLKREEASKDTLVDWKKTLTRLKSALTGRNQARADEARKEIDAIDNPAAAGPLLALVRSEDDPALRRLWLDTAARLETSGVIFAMVDLSIHDDNDEIRYRCLEHLTKKRRPGILAPYLQALGSTDNVIINRAAVALGKIDDPDAIGPLIDALITEHKVQVSGGNPGQMGASMSNGGRGGMSFGGGGPKFENRSLRNPDVLAALLTLSKISGFEYNEARWQEWLAARAKSQRINLRRDM